MSCEYKVIADPWCLTAGSKAKKIERHLNQLAQDGWELAKIDPVMVLGFDVGFYLVLQKEKS